MVKIVLTYHINCVIFYYDRYTMSVVVTTDVVGKEVEMSGISSDVIRGYNDTMILYLLLDEPSYGYEISKRIKQLSNDKYIIKETTLYSAFTRLEKNGYVESFRMEDKESVKRRTYYKITEAGKEYYREKCVEWYVTKEVVEKFIEERG